MFKTPLLGLVVPFAGQTPPPKWMFCQGQELPISLHDALFSLIGNLYGGDGIQTFALPNFCGRVAVHSGQAPQMQNYIPGQTGGREKAWITTGNLPVHSHQLSGSITASPPCSTTSVDDSSDLPRNNYPRPRKGGGFLYSDVPDAAIKMGTTAIAAPIQQDPALPPKEKEPVYIMSPFLVMNYIICIDGIWPGQG